MKLSSIKHSPKIRKTAIWLAGIIAAIAVLGFLVAPPLVKHFGQKILSDALQRPVTIQDVGINPFAMSALVKGVVVKEKDGATDALRVGGLSVDLEAESVFRGGFVLHAVTLADPYLHLVRNADQTYNFTDLIEKFLNQPESESEPTRFSVNNIRVMGGRIDFDDRPVKAQHVVSDIEIGVPFISNLPSKVAINVQPSFSAKINGSPLTLGGRARPFQATRDAALNLDVDGLDLPRYLAYSPLPLKFTLPSGRLDTRLLLTFAQPQQGPPTLTLAGDIVLKQFAVTEKDGRPILNLPRLAVKVQAAQVFARKVALAAVHIEGPEVWLAREQGGAIRQLGLLMPGESANAGAKAEADKPAASAGAKAAKAPPLAWSAGEIKLTGGKLHFSDATVAPAFKTDVTAADVVVNNLGSAPGQAATAQAEITTAAGETITHKGSLTLAPLAAKGHLELAAVQLPAYAPYYADKILARVMGGTLDVATDYDFAFAENAPKLVLDGLALKLAGLGLRHRDDKDDFLRLGAAQLAGGKFDLAAHSVSIREVSTRDAKLRIVRAKDGALSVTKIVPASPAAEPAAGAQQPWALTLEKLAVSGYDVLFEDRTLPEPVKLSVTGLDANAENIGNQKGQQVKFTVSAKVNKRGTIKLSGSSVLEPLQASVTVAAKGIEIVPFQPYFADKVNVTITRGALSARGNLRVDLPPAKAAKIGYRGDATIGNLRTVDQFNAADFLVWKSLHFGGINLGSVEPLKLDVREVALADFYSRLILNANGQFNLQQVVRGSEEEPASDTKAAAPNKDVKTAAKPQEAAGGVTPDAASPDAPSKPPDTPAKPTPPLQYKIAVQRVTLQNGRVNFSDFFVKPNYSADIRQLGGRVTGLSSDPGTIADVELRGEVSDAPLEILGKVNPLSGNLFLDLTANAKGIELPQFTPYSGKYAGYAIEKGKLSVDLAYKVENRKLEARNGVFLDQLTFGDKVDSPDATKLPVLLAVSLLKNRRGEIDVKLPISGSLDDPQFSVGGLIVQVIVNLIVKAVTAPFALLGSMFGGGEELAYVEYDYGRPNLTEAAQKKLDILAKALNDRPALKLEITGRVDPSNDREGLKQAVVAAKVRAQKFAELAKKEEAPESADAVTVGQDEYAKYLERAYKQEKFPKPRNFIGLAKSLPVAEMEKLMLANAPASDDDLRQLANQRAAAVKDYLTETGKVPAERVFLLAPKLSAGEAKEVDKTKEKAKEKTKLSRADFSLR